MTETMTIYKIRLKDTKMYSRGRVEKGWHNGVQDCHKVSWKAAGKEWPTEKALKNHLVTCITKNVDMTGWEIMEFTQQPSRALNEWFDARMTFAVLKHTK